MVDLTPIMKGTSEESGDCADIKGNINRQGKKIYHIQGGRSYDEVNPEEVFCSEQEEKKPDSSGRLINRTSNRYLDNNRRYLFVDGSSNCYYGWVGGRQR